MRRKTQIQRTKRLRRQDALATREVVFNGKPVARVWFDGPKAAFFVRNFETGETKSCGSHEGGLETVRESIPKEYRSMVHLRRL